MRGTGWAFREVWVWVDMGVGDDQGVQARVRNGWALGQGDGGNSPWVQELGDQPWGTRQHGRAG